MESIFNIKTTQDFNEAAFTVFKHQFENNRVYRSFCDLLYKHPSTVNTINDIPFLPIAFFKSQKVIAKNKSVETVFSSSGTTGKTTSKHYVSDLQLYEKSFSIAFETAYGPIEDYVILALLPSYLERTGSSLVYMVDCLIKKTNNPNSGFYLNNFKALSETLLRMDASGKKVLLLGVSHALLDLVEAYKFKLKNTIVMETGGMKGRRKELVRAELHSILMNGFGVNAIHSEYGMTELLSQAYSTGNGLFTPSPWMKVLARDTEDPLCILPENKTGGLNIIDLANIHSCAFIATQDLGRVGNSGSFEVIGRFDNSDIRGCNLMVL